MSVTIVVLFLAAYCVPIGGWLAWCGYTGRDLVDQSGVVWWPVVIVFLLVRGIVLFPFRLGQWLRRFNSKTHELFEDEP